MKYVMDLGILLVVSLSSVSAFALVNAVDCGDGVQRAVKYDRKSAGYIVLNNRTFTAAGILNAGDHNIVEFHAFNGSIVPDVIQCSVVSQN